MSAYEFLTDDERQLIIAAVREKFSRASAKTINSGLSPYFSTLNPFSWFMPVRPIVLDATKTAYENEVALRDLLDKLANSDILVDKRA